MISSAFPPTGGPGVQRSAKFAKYLSDFGWEPVVWAAEHTPDLPYDESLVADLPKELTVHRSRLWDPRNALHARHQTHDDVTAQTAWRLERWVSRLRAALVPDPMIGWALRSYRTCRALIDEHNIAAIYSTYSPASNHLLGCLLRHATGLPWVADFRDLWTDDYAYPYRNTLRGKLEHALENWIVNSASAVVAVSDGQRDVLRERSKVQPNGKRPSFHTIPNGFDHVDFADLNAGAIRERLHGSDDRFVLTFTGWFLSDRVSEGLIDGISQFAEWTQRQPGSFVLRIVGKISEKMCERFRSAGVEVETPGYVAHDSAIEYMVASDALLLLVPSGPNAQTLVTGKIFEYLASGKPIVLVAPSADCEASQVLRRCRAGVHCLPDAQAVSVALRAAWLRWRGGSLRSDCRPSDIQRYSRRQLTGELANIFSEVACCLPSH